MFISKLMDEVRPYINTTLVVIVYFAVVGSTLVFLAGSHPSFGSRMTYARTSSIEFASVKKEIVPSIDMVLSYGNVTAYVPKGGTNAAGYLSMILREPNLFPEAGEPGWSRPFAANVEIQNYQGTPAPSVTFFKTARICFQVNEKMWWDYNKHPAAYQVEYYAKSQAVPRWVELPMVAEADHLQLCGETDHFSLFALAINVGENFSNPLIPITGAMTSATPIPTIAPSILIPTDILPTKAHNKGSSPVIAPIIATTAAPPTVAPTEIPPTDPPTDIVHTDPPPTDLPTDAAPTNPPATDPPATDPAGTNPPSDTSAPPSDTPSG